MEINNLLHDIESVPTGKKLIVFDLDGTLTESKSEIADDMAVLLGQLLETKKVAVIGGGRFGLFQRQVLSKLSVSGELLKHLFLFPTTATAFYRYENNDWIQVYSQHFSKEEKERALSSLGRTLQELNYKHPDKIYGEPTEDRGAEITFSTLGQEAPTELKEKWNKENPDIRAKIEEVLQKYLPDMEVKVAGLSSIDITRKGVDKAYGIRQMEKYLGIPVENMLFVGDNFAHEGNDEPVLGTGVLCFEVKGPEDTKRLIKYLFK